MQRWAILLLGVLLGIGSAMASAAQALDRAPLLDQLEIVRLERELLALGAAGGDARVRLELDEQVVWTGSQGVVGAAVTDRRLLFVAAGNGTWQEVRLRRDEKAPTAARVSDRVVLADTSRRLLGFSEIGGAPREYQLGPNERVEAVEVAEGVGIAVTDRKALGYSAQRGGFFEISLEIREQIESIDVRAELATLRTNRRLLVFRGLSGVWSERSLKGS